MITKLQNQNFNQKFTVSYAATDVQEPLTSVDVNSEQPAELSLDKRMDLIVEFQSSEISIEDICSRERISQETFLEWNDEFLKLSSVGNFKKNPKTKNSYTENEKFQIVIEGKCGDLSIAEICRRENISHDTYLEWSQSFVNLRKRKGYSRIVDSDESLKNINLIKNKLGKSVFSYFENYIDFWNDECFVDYEQGSINFNNKVDNIVGLYKVNDVRYINKYFELVNSKLNDGGVFVGCLETFAARRKRMRINKIPVLNGLYFGLEFLIKRILPKVSFTKKYYFDITKGNDRLLSKAEGLGRLVSCGFKIMDYNSIDGMLYFVVKKVSTPKFDLNPSFGPVYKMNRLGKNGKLFGVYKFRTMHPYSEYLQDYIVNAHGYSSSGKPANDFRIPAWGKFMRRFWLDETPQLLNVLKGNMKLVGIRPVSERYFKDIPKEMQKLRLTQKPGCIPPYVALNREGNVISVLQAEKDYLVEKIKNPYTTDLKYFFMAVKNILFKHKRSA